MAILKSNIATGRHRFGQMWTRMRDGKSTRNIIPTAGTISFGVEVGVAEGDGKVIGFGVGLGVGLGVGVAVGQGAAEGEGLAVPAA